MSRPVLLAVIEIGGYPDFRPVYEQAGFEVFVESKMRKAMSFIKKNKPALVVAEFNFQSDFRDRTSSLESMMSVVERLPETKVIIFYEKEYAHQFDRLRALYTFYKTFTFPVSDDQLARAVNAASASGQESVA